MRARGLRNPYRTSFDRVTGDLYLADVGQDEREEVNVLAANALAGAGPNFGWRAWEGTAQNAAVCPGDALCATPAAVKVPVYDYPHRGSFCDGSVTGGYAYRGPDPALQGHYFFADFCQGFIKSFVWDGANGVTNLVDRSAELTPDAGSIDVVTGFGEGGDGALYLVDWHDGELYAVPEPNASLLAAAAFVTLAGRRSLHPRPGPLFTAGRSASWLRRG